MKKKPNHAAGGYEVTSENAMYYDIDNDTAMNNSLPPDRPCKTTTMGVLGSNSRSDEGGVKSRPLFLNW